MKRRLKDKKGSITLLYFGLVFLLLMLTFLIVEMGSAMENYSYAESVLQRACNSAVEANIDDSFRADHILKMDTAGAKADFLRYVRQDLPSKYDFQVSTIQCTSSPPGMMVIGRIRFATVFSQFGFRARMHTIKVISTNYALDGR